MTRYTNIARTTALLAVASGLLALTTPAFATAVDDDAVPHGTLNVAGTDFTSAKAVDHLKARVRRMAFNICVPDGGTTVLLPADQVKCYKTAISTGMAQIAGKQEQAMRATSVKMASAQTDTQPAH